MAIVSCTVDSFKLEQLLAIHDFSSDVIKAACYTSDANLGYNTAVYSATNEAVGANYPPGGIQLRVTSGYPAIVAHMGVVAFDDATVANVTLTFRAILLYNASKANRAIAVLDRGVDVVLTNGPLTFKSSTTPFLVRVV